jgi:hypothetical protein
MYTRRVWTTESERRKIMEKAAKLQSDEFCLFMYTYMIVCQHIPTGICQNLTDNTEFYQRSLLISPVNNVYQLNAEEVHNFIDFVEDIKRFKYV